MYTGAERRAKGSENGSGKWMRDSEAWLRVLVPLLKYRCYPMLKHITNLLRPGKYRMEIHILCFRTLIIDLSIKDFSLIGNMFT